MQEGSREMTCKVCLSTNVRCVSDSHGYRLSECDDCSHVYVTDPVDAGTLEAVYGRDYYGGTEASEAIIKGGHNIYKDYLGTAEKRTAAFKARLHQVSRFVEKPGKILDYGCAIGLFVKVAKDGGWHARGYERSAWAASYGREHFGIDIEHGDGSYDPFAAASFDVITLWDLLEHLESPREILQKMHRWLRLGGFLFANTVNRSSVGARLAGNRWRHLQPPVHLQYFTRQSLTRLFDQVGFKIVSVTSNGTLFSSRKSERPLGMPLRQLERIATNWRFRDWATALNLLDEIEVVAVRQ
jgi:SAM-dependent methyltransferase